MAERSAHAVRFGPFVVDLRAGELYQDGGRVRLQEQPFKILALLLARPGEIVTREELRVSLWPEESLVDFDHRINVAIGKIRLALGQAHDGRPFIETVGKRGYRFIQAVQKTTPRLDLSPQRSGPPPVNRTLCPILVGREGEMAHLAAALEAARRGNGQIVVLSE